MAGGGKKVVTIFSAVANAVKHALGVLKGFYNAFKGAFDVFKKVMDTIDQIYDKTIGWIKEKLGPIYEVYEDLRDLYRDYVKPVLDWVERTLRELKATFELFKGDIQEALRLLDEKTFGWIKDLHKRVDHILEDLQGLAEAFDERLAKQIGEIRKWMRDNIIKRINEVEKRLYDVQEWLQKYVFKYIDAFSSWVDMHVIKTKKSLDSLFDDIDKLLGIDRKPKGSHAKDQWKDWGWLMMESYGARHCYMVHVEPLLPSQIDPALLGEGANPMIELYRKEVGREPSYGMMINDEVEAEGELEGRESAVFAKLYEALSDEEREFWEVSRVDARRYWGDWEELVRFEAKELSTPEDIDYCPIWKEEEKERRPKPTLEEPPRMSGEEWFRWYGYEAPPE